MKLISMTDFVLHLRGMTTTELCSTYPKTFRMPAFSGDKDDFVKQMLGLDARLWKQVGEYAKFLKRPLKVDMFVVCDCNGNLLKDPSNRKDGRIFKEMLDQFEACKTKVLFKGFKFSGNGFFTCGEEYLISQYEDGKFKWLVNEGKKQSTFYKVETIGDIANLGGGIEFTNPVVKELGLETSMNVSAI